LLADDFAITVYAITVYAITVFAMTVFAITLEDGTIFGKGRPHQPPRGHFEGMWKWRSHRKSE